MNYSNETPNMPPKRLYRSRTNRMIAGVCGGLGEYANVDPVIIRILFVLLFLFGGLGLILYLVGVIIIPENPHPASDLTPKKEKDNALFWGGLLVIIGALLLLGQLNYLPPINFWALPWNMIWAILLIALGIFLLWKPSDQKSYAEPDTTTTKPTTEEIHQEQTKQKSSKVLYRSKRNRMIAGVCGGLADYFNMDPTIVRLLYVLLTFFSKGLGVLAYIILILAVPEEKENEV